MTMVTSWLFLSRRYKKVHLIGAGIILAGITLAMVQILTRGNPGVNHPKNEVDSSDGTWTIIFFFSCIPLAIGSCLKEHILTHRIPVDMNQVNAWVAISQLVIGLAISPLSYMAANLYPGAPETRGGGWSVSMAGFSDNLRQGLACGVYGDHTACNAQCMYVLGNSTGCVAGIPCDCGLSMAPVSVWLYVGVCCCFNLLMLYVIKEGTAVLFWISSAAIIPVVACISTTPVYTWLKLGKVAFTLMQICGLVLVVLGIAVYRSKPEESDSGNSKEESDDAYARASIVHNIKSFLDGEEESQTPGAHGSPSPRAGANRVQYDTSAYGYGHYSSS
jgi:hypothetical protein